ncbi:Stp1/IreP family PP2C-type Ser/Thr phosphatase [Sulfoacidibacillus thermotolerans]|uniref:PPM-type phosphatase domain-containing protein n=1 Tax=Sulfoacidibacillus thermotolerans TaxID=1765684 RepID=A0A2U3D7T1_SULT2|nr:Stp1/IreP family PP2C-type Ser/Thr phosphatase [Sulfoacidibacillus thermotolerans]PWI57338.1 hypothetical protein BM613_09060 [Sulfoacidibacillus thermotolerans]
MQFAAASHVGLVRKVNQDGYLILSEQGKDYLVCVADGMGGHVAGEVASALALQTIREVMQQGVENDQETRLQQAILSANQRVYEQSVQTEKYAGMGTTIVAALLERESIWLAHVGDSRAYLLRGDGELSQLTEDHSLVNELLRRGQIQPQEAIRHPQRHLLTRALGTLPDVVVECRNLAWTTGDMFFICSDGLTTHVADEQLRSILSTAEDLQVKVDQLIQAALDNGGHDNVTVVAVLHDGRLEEEVMG